MGLQLMPRDAAMDVARFPSTQWSLVGRAGHITGTRRREALGTLLHRYMPAMRTHLVLARRMSPDQADDLVQGFVTDKIIEQNLLAQAEQARGQFRSFLLVALNRYVIGQYRHDTAQKRSPSGPMLDIADQHDVSAADAEPSWQFTLAWAREVIEQVRRRMETHCRQINRPDLWLVFTERVLRPAADNDARPHERIAGDLQLQSAKAASNLLITAKRLFARVLRLIVSEYVSDQRAIDEEIEDLMRILSQHG
jgi:hypothetical protein